MHHSSIISIIILFLFAHGIVYGQSTKRKKSKDFHFELTFSGGAASAQSISDMSDAMIDAGLDDDTYVNVSHYTFPTTEKEFGVLDLTLAYKWNDHSGIVLGGGILERFEVSGKAEITEDGYLFLSTNVHQVRCQYQRRTANSRAMLTIGPSLTFFKIIDTYPAWFWQQNYSSSVPGLAGGFQYNVINGKVFFLSLAVNGQYTLPAEIGKFYAHRVHVPPTQFSKVVYQPDDIHFSNIGAYIGIGFRI